MVKTNLSRCLLVAIVLCRALCAGANGSHVTVILRAFDNGEQPAWLLGTQFLEALHHEDEGYTVTHFDERTPLDTIRRDVYGNASDWFYLHQDYDNAIGYGLKALPLCEGRPEQADWLNILAMCYLRKGDYAQAARYAKQCYELDEATGDPDVMSSSLNTIAGIYLAANRPSEAERYILRAIDLARRAQNPARLATLESTASEVYHALVNDTLALEHIDRACALERQLGREERWLARQVQKSSILNGLHRYAEAEALLSEAIPRLRATGDRHTLGIALNKLGMAIYSQHRPARAVAPFGEAAAIFVRLGDAGNELHSRRGLYESLWTINPDSAKIELARFDLLKDSLYQTASAESLARITAELNNDWLEQDAAHKQRVINRQRLALAVCLIAVILLAAGLWRLKRRERARVAAMQFIIDRLRHDASEPSATSTTAAAPAPQGEQDDTPTAGKELLEQLIHITMSALPDGDLSIESMARQMATSRGNLNRKVKTLTGMTTRQFVTQVRLEHACRLLADTDLPVAEVGYRCGFDNVVSFSRAFKRKTGYAPSDYRQR